MHDNPAMQASIPSIRSRIAGALLAWAVVWGIAVAVAVWLAVQQEVDELLDDTLQASAALLSTVLSIDGGAQATLSSTQSNAPTGDQFAWQVVNARGELLLRSPLAPTAALHSAPHAGFTNTPDWRVFGSPLPQNMVPGQAAEIAAESPAVQVGRMLYVAQAREERDELQTEIALSAALVALAVGLLGHLWLRSRLRQELSPLQTLSDRLVDYDPLDANATLGSAERAELQPVHSAIDALAKRLNQRLLHERAFSAHAAHSLRTPLAGIDAQLAVALRECPPDLQARLQRVRDGAGRLQRVVAALLTLFRTGVELHRQAVDLRALLIRLPLDGLSVDAESCDSLHADPDLLAAALVNLLDNSLRNGAKHVVVSTPSPHTVRLADDGPGISPERRRQLQAALTEQRYEKETGLGLMLADLVARSHAGHLLLPETASGFAVELVLDGGQGQRGLSKNT